MNAGEEESEMDTETLDLESETTSCKRSESGEEKSLSEKSGESESSSEDGAEDDENDAENTSDEEELDAPENLERRLHSARTVGEWSNIMGRLWKGANLVTDELDRVREESIDAGDLPVRIEKAMLTKDRLRNI